MGNRRASTGNKGVSGDAGEGGAKIVRLGVPKWDGMGKRWRERGGDEGVVGDGKREEEGPPSMTEGG